MLLGELNAAFPWGVLQVTDDASTEPIPSWSSEDEQVTFTDSALVVRVMHGQEGRAEVWVWSIQGEVDGSEAFRGFLEVPSGTLRVADALSDQIVRLPLEPGRHSVKVFVDEPREASKVHVVIDPSS